MKHAIFLPLTDPACVLVLLVSAALFYRYIQWNDYIMYRSLHVVSFHRLSIAVAGNIRIAKYAGYSIEGGIDYTEDQDCSTCGCVYGREIRG